jgi:predicted DNA-binding transcriptional regulator YafY
VVIPIEAVDQTAADLIRLGADAEVLEPLELRRRIAEMVRDLSRLYGDARGA